MVRKALLNCIVISWKGCIFLIGLFLISSCSTVHLQYGKNARDFSFDAEKDTVIQQVTIIGNTNFDQDSISHRLFRQNNEQDSNQKTTRTLLVIGDNAKRTFTPDNRKSNFTYYDKIYFIAGRTDWSDGLNSLLEKQSEIDQIFGNGSFLPHNGCGIETIQLSKDVILLALNSQWFLENWDHHKQLNENCAIKSREEFFKEFENQLNLNENKQILITSYHPMFSNGEYGGQFSAKQHLYPLPVKLPLPGIGTLYNFIRKTSGLYPQDLQNFLYRTYLERITSLTANRKNVVFLSAHEHNIQYVEQANQKQVISGGASSTTSARAVGKKDFSYGGNGYATLNFYADKRAEINFFRTQNNRDTLVFNTELFSPAQQPIEFKFQPIPPTYSAQIYTDELTKKTKLYSALFGKLYRKFYSTKVESHTLDLSTFKGGLRSILSQDQQQTRNLIIETNDNQQYTLQPLAKSATRYLQAIAFKNQYVEKDLEDTFTEKFLLDFYTATNPYFQFAIGDLAKSVNLYHTNPELYFLPMQKDLGVYNENFGEKLYLVEENPVKESKNSDSFGRPDDIVETEKLLQNLRTNANQIVDESFYIRQRLFDMLIGDWDRYDKQLRWALFVEGKDTLYRPIPIDRDQAFPNYDGPLTRFAMRFPIFKHMQNFQEKIPNIKWLNMESYALDLALLKSATLEDWLKQASIIEKSLTNTVVDNAFKKIPIEIQGPEVETVKNKINTRKNDLNKYAEQYYKVLMKTVLIKGTDNANSIIVTRKPKGKTTVQIFDQNDESHQPVFKRDYYKNQTRNLWIYGLNGADSLTVNGKPENPILIRLIGGKDDDVYKVSKGRKVRIYDFSSENNNTKNAGKAKTYLTRDYDLNSYDFMKPKYNKFGSYPTIGYNPDDGLRLGFSAVYTVNNFDRKPFTRRHSLDFFYYFATGGYEFTYDGLFAKFIGKWNLELKAKVTSTNYSTNFFGLGNETKNDENELGMDYNRVRTRLLRFDPSLFRINNDNSQIRFAANIENIYVEKTDGRFISISPDVNPKAIGHQYFTEVGMKYTYRNFDNMSIPTLGMLFEVGGYWKNNLQDSKRSFAYLVGSIGFINKITRNETLTFGTLIKWQTNLNENYEFHQAATIGGDTDLRAYRSSRFAGQYSYSQSTDLRLEIARIRRFIIPMKIGIIGGYDYGRVWMDGEKSKKWHQAIGGGIWLNAIDSFTGKVNYFTGEDGGRFSLGVNFGF